MSEPARADDGTALDQNHDFRLCAPHQPVEAGRWAKHAVVGKLP
ncbi:MAG TPA: hypothetical protein VH988_09575 [Thermoanaerobaculia bacterium]|nr:hypothetical protein [Thermoanaerobaculia bacterium]